LPCDEKAPGALTPRAVSLMSHQLAKEDEQKLNKGQGEGPSTVGPATVTTGPTSGMPPPQPRGERALEVAVVF
jgi:hypothetical protein